MVIKKCVLIAIWTTRLIDHSRYFHSHHDLAVICLIYCSKNYVFHLIYIIYILYVDFIMSLFITKKSELYDLSACASQVKHKPIRNDTSRGHLPQKLVTLHARRRQSWCTDVNKLLSGGHIKMHMWEMRRFMHAVMKLTHVYVNVTGAEEEEASVPGICVCVCVQMSHRIIA